jgi:hypothetical protein
MANLVWGIFFTLVILFVKLTIDFNKWLNLKKVNHTLEWRILAIASLIPTYFFISYSNSHWFITGLISSGMISFFIWIFFDGLYNLLRGYNWWFTGSDDEDDAKTDDFLQKLTLTQHKLIKIIGLIIFVIFYLLTTL